MLVSLLPTITPFLHHHTPSWHHLHHHHHHLWHHNSGLWLWTLMDLFQTHHWCFFTFTSLTHFTFITSWSPSYAFHTDHSFISPWSLIYQSLITIPHSAHVALSRSSSSHTLLLSILSLLSLHSHCSGHTSHCHGPSSYIGSQIVAGVSLALQFQEILSPSQPSCTVTDKQVVSFGRNSSTPLALLHSVLSLYCCYPFTQNESRPTLIEISPQFEAHLY